MIRPESWRKLNQRAEDSDRKTWRDWHDVNPWLFPLPSELANHPGQIGLLMSRIANEIRRDADRCPDPWADLCSSQFIPRSFHALFRACVSVLPAALHLARAVYSRGDLIERASQASTEVEYETVIGKLFPGMWRAGAGILRDAAIRGGSETLREFEGRESRLLKMIEKKHGKGATISRSDKPTAEPLRRKYPLSYLMLIGWIRCGPSGDPGLMFYSDSALTDLFSLLNWQEFEITATDLGSEQIEQMRGRLGLRKANAKRPLVTMARLNPDTNLIELNTLDAKVAKGEWPKRPWTLRCRLELSGKLLYGGLPP